MLRDEKYGLIGRRTCDEDVCAAPLFRRVAALLDQPCSFRPGEVVPRGWHMALFTPCARQSALGRDGVAVEETLLPNPDPARFPRKMLGGRRIVFHGDLHIGAAVRRDSEIVSATSKEGRTGRLLVVTLSHRIFEEGSAAPVIVEEQDSIFREAPESSSAASVPAASGSPAAEPRRHASLRRSIVFDPMLLFRYSAITFNAHRIHFDDPYTRHDEGYPALLVNGGLPALLLVEMARAQLDSGIRSVTTRNLRPLYCNRQASLLGERSAGGWRMWAEDELGRTALEIEIS
ncbi:MAG: hypothetical protein AB7L76_22600 [Burkholderiaceae bacterium]